LKPCGGSTDGVTSEQDCIEALREARERLGESPTIQQYEQLELTPSSSTISRVMGGWNDAKAAAGLETYASSGPRTKPKPDDVDLPPDTSWEDLTVDQRWHYRHKETNAERSRQRRAHLRAWIHRLKQDRGCRRCEEHDPACLDFHHVEQDDKEMQVGRMVAHGYSKTSIRAEIEKCVVLCANCHRKEHYEPPAEIAEDAGRRQQRNPQH
jgi:hypothetical protein